MSGLNNKGKGIKILQTILVFVASILMLTACDSAGPTIGGWAKKMSNVDIITKHATLRADGKLQTGDGLGAEYGQWTNTGVEFAELAQLDFLVYGEINLKTVDDIITVCANDSNIQYYIDGGTRDCSESFTPTGDMSVINLRVGESVFATIGKPRVIGSNNPEVSRVIRCDDSDLPKILSSNPVIYTGADQSSATKPCAASKGLADDCYGANGLGLEISSGGKIITYAEGRAGRSNSKMNFSNKVIPRIIDYIKCSKIMEIDESGKRVTKAEGSCSEDDLNKHTNFFASWSNVLQVVKKTHGNIAANGKKLQKSFCQRGLYFGLAPDDDRGKLGFRIHDPDGNYQENSGSYKLHINYSGSKRQAVKDGIPSPSLKKSGAIEYIFTDKDMNNLNKQDQGSVEGDIKVLELGKNKIKGGGVSEVTSREKGKLWLRVRDQGENATYSFGSTDYRDNSGKYVVHYTFKVLQHKGPGVLASIAQKVSEPVEKKTLEVAELIYGKIVESHNFKGFVKALMVLYVIIYAILFMLGLTQVTISDLTTRIVKIAIVSILISDTSWHFFNINLFEFIHVARDRLIMDATGMAGVADATSASSPLQEIIGTIFGFIDNVFDVVFHRNIGQIILALGFTFMGIIVLFMLCYILWVYLFVIAEAFIGYLMALVGISLMISIAPIFISMILFERTKSYFDGWLGYLINFSLQPVLLFTTLIIMNYLIMIVIIEIMGQRVEWEPYLDIFFDIKPLLKDIGIPFPWRKIYLHPLDIYWFSVEITSLFTKIVMLMLLVQTLKGMNGFIPIITNKLTGMVAGVTPLTGANSPARNVIEKVQDTIKWTVGIDEQSKARRKSRIGVGAREGEIRRKMFKQSQQATGATRPSTPSQTGAGQ